MCHGLKRSSSTSFRMCIALHGDVRHTPIITTADCEGAGEMFRISAEKAAFCQKCPIVTASGRMYEPRERRRSKARPQRTARSSLVERHILRWRALAACCRQSIANRLGWKRAAKVSGQLAVENFCCGLGDAAA